MDHYPGVGKDNLLRKQETAALKDLRLEVRKPQAWGDLAGESLHVLGLWLVEVEFW